MNSSLPYEGRVEIKLKQSIKNVAVRVPEWIADDSEQVSCKGGEKPRKIAWQRRYVRPGAGKAGGSGTSGPAPSR